MSLILDALKKSEEERRRGQPPSLHSPLYLPRRAQRRVPVWAASAGAVVLCAGLAGVWWVQGRPGEEAGAAALAEAGGDSGKGGTAPSEPVTTVSTAAVADEAPVAVALAPPAMPERFATMPGPAERESLPMSPEQGAAALGGVDGLRPVQRVSGGGSGVPDRSLNFTPTVVVVVPPADAQNPGVPAPGELEPKDDVAAQAAIPAPAMQPAASPVVVDAAPVAPAVPAVAPSPARATLELGNDVPAVHELAYATRRELPKLDLTMHVYSRLAEERFVVLNGKRYTQATPALGPDLNLVDIVADGVVLEFRGQRFLLPRQTF
jgi:general secretion pathway protein B